MNINQSNALADVLENTRQLSRFYLSYTTELDVGKRFNINEFKTNSIHWIVAHMTWAEDYLILKGVGNKSMELPWFDLFRIGKESPDKEDYPGYAETMDAFAKVHATAISLLRSLDDQQLDQKNYINVTFDGHDTKRSVIMHCIRHEGMHCGHLSWLLRMHGRKVV